MVKQEYIAEWFLRAQKIAHLGLWDQDPTTNELWWSDEVYWILGLEPQGISPSFDKFLQVVHPDDRYLIVKQTELALTNEDHRYRVEYRIIRPDKSERFIYEEAVVERDKHGTPTKITGILQDITDRKMAEEALLRTTSIITSSDDAIISKNLDGIIQDWNYAAEKMFGYMAEEAIGKPMLTLIPDDRKFEEFDILSRIVQGERIEHFETIRQRKDGSFIEISATISPILNTHNEIIGISKIARDISERKRAEEEIRKKDKLLAEISSRLPGLLFQFVAGLDGTRKVSYVTGQARNFLGLDPKPESFFERFTAAIHPVIVRIFSKR